MLLYYYCTNNVLIHISYIYYTYGMRLQIDLDTFVLKKVDKMALSQKRARKNMIEIIIQDAVNS